MPGSVHKLENGSWMQMIAPCPGHRIFDAQTLHGGDCYGVPTQQEKTKADVTVSYFFILCPFILSYKLIQFTAPPKQAPARGDRTCCPPAFVERILERSRLGFSELGESLLDVGPQRSSTWLWTWKCWLNPFLPNGFADHYPYEKWLFHWGFGPHFQTYPNAESGVGMVPWIWYRSNHM